MRDHQLMNWVWENRKGWCAVRACRRRKRSCLLRWAWRGWRPLFSLWFRMRNAGCYPEKNQLPSTFTVLGSWKKLKKLPNVVFLRACAP